MLLNAQTFLDLLPIVADQTWHIGLRGGIRDIDDVCPICAIVNEILGEKTWQIAAYTAIRALDKDIDVDILSLDEFINAADNISNWEIRSQIIEILGL